MVSESSLQRYRALIQKIGVEEARRVAELEDSEWREAKQLLGITTNKKESVLKQRNMVRLLLRDLEQEAEQTEEAPVNPRAQLVRESVWSEDYRRLQEELEAERRQREEAERAREEAEQRLREMEEEIRRLREEQERARREQEEREREEQERIRKAMEEIEKELESDLGGFKFHDIVIEPIEERERDIQYEEELTEADFEDSDEEPVEEDENYEPVNPIGHLDYYEQELMEDIFPTDKFSYEKEGMEIDKYRGQNSELIKYQFLRDLKKQGYEDGKVGIRFEYYDRENMRNYTFYKDFRIKRKSLRQIEQEIDKIINEAEEKYGKAPLSVTMALYR